MNVPNDPNFHKLVKIAKIAILSCNFKVYDEAKEMISNILQKCNPGFPILNIQVADFILTYPLPKDVIKFAIAEGNKKLFRL